METGTDMQNYGFSTSPGSIHSSRTMMFDDISRLLEAVPDENAPKEAYRHAVVTENCLAKKSANNRTITFKNLAGLYALDPSVVLFRALRYFWARDPAARPQLALLCSYARDPLLRASAPYIQSLALGEQTTSDATAAASTAHCPNRFSHASLRSLGQNLNGTWTIAGWLEGKTTKTRIEPTPEPGSTAYALLMGYLHGCNGSMLFATEYTTLLGGTRGMQEARAETAARRGWMCFRHIDDVIDVSFPCLAKWQTEV